MRSNIDESVDRYLSGAMPEEERRAFEASIAGDADAQKLLAADRAIGRSFAGSSLANSALQTVPNSVLLGYLGQTRPEGTKRWIAYSCIAAFVLIVSALVLYTAEYRSPNSPQAPFSQPQPTVQADTIRLVPTRVQEDTAVNAQSAAQVEPRAVRSKPTQTLNEKPAPPKLYNADSVTMHIDGR